MKIMCIWNKDGEKTFMKIARSKAELNNAKVGGRKPDKMITKASEIDRMRVSDLKKFVSYDGLIVVDGKVVYNKAAGIV